MDTERLSPWGRLVRLLVSVAYLSLLLAGTAFGDDDPFPFGPFRMYSTSTPPNGDVHIMALAARMPGGVYRTLLVAGFVLFYLSVLATITIMFWPQVLCLLLCSLPTERLLAAHRREAPPAGRAFPDAEPAPVPSG